MFKQAVYVYFESSQGFFTRAHAELPAPYRQFSDLRPPGTRPLSPRRPFPPLRVDQDPPAGEVVVQAPSGSISEFCL